jgi:hypothetical protein
MANINAELEALIKQRVITMLDMLLSQLQDLEELILAYKIIHKKTKASNDIKARYARGEYLGFAKYNAELGKEALSARGIKLTHDPNYKPRNKGLKGMQTLSEEHKKKLHAGRDKYYNRSNDNINH